MGPFPSEGEQTTAVETPSEREQTTAMETPPEVVKEVARLIVEEQVDEIVRQTPDGEDQEASDNAADTTPVGGNRNGEKQEEETPLSEPESEPESTSELTWEEPWWYAQYSEKRAERRKEIEEERAAYQAEIDAQIAAQAESVRKEAGIVEAEESGEYIRPLLERGMTQDKLVSNMLQIIRDGYGPYITPDELSLIKNDDIREQMRYSPTPPVDSPLALFRRLLRRMNVTRKAFAVRWRICQQKFIKAETAESRRLTQKYNFAETLMRRGLRVPGKLALEVFPPRRVRHSTDRAVSYHSQRGGKRCDCDEPQLAGETSISYSTSCSSRHGELAKKALSNLRDVAIYLSGDIASQ